MLLNAAKSGDIEATNKLFTEVYSELKLIARANRRRWRGNQTMNTTALIHEVFLKLARPDKGDFANRTHFFATAARAMRQILVNYAKHQQTEKRGGGAMRVTFDETVLSSETNADEILAIHQLLSDLESKNPRRCRIIECRVFGGMTVEEVSEALEISPATVKREWSLGTATLFQALQRDQG
ncbi:MAG: ECF-type sigma factor [Gammaproteobacteria bacterium]|nr:ECF-type sigma factor [Gammaproteobacteria bacterium]